MCCSGLYFHLLALCVFVHIPPQPHGPLPRLSSSLFFPPSSESSSNSSFPSITFLYRSASVVSPPLSLSLSLFHPPFRSLPLNPFLALRLCLISSPFSHRFSSTPAYPPPPSYHAPHSVVPTLFARCASLRRVFLVSSPSARDRR